MPSLAGSGRSGAREAHKMKTLMVSAAPVRLGPARPGGGRRRAARGCPGLGARAPACPGRVLAALCGAGRRARAGRRRRRTFRMLSFIRVARGLGILCVCVCVRVVRSGWEAGLLKGRGWR